MHICYLCNEYPPDPHGGVGTVLQALARALVGRGHRVTVVGISSNGQRTEDDRGVTVVRVAHARWRGTGFAAHRRRIGQAIRAIHRTHPIDLIEGQELTFALLGRRAPAPTIIRMNGGHHFFSITLGEEAKPWRSWQERRSFQNADFLCAASRFLANTTAELLALGDRPIEILPNAVDADAFCPEPAVHVQDGLIVFAGTVCEKKGVRQLLGAMPTVLEKHPGAQLLVVGRDWEDGRGNSFTARMRSELPRSVAARVEFTGPVPHHELGGVLARAAVCAFPSHMEGLPLMWLEAMAMGKPVLGSATGPGPEVIEDGVSGLLCDPHSSESIAAALVRLLDDPSLRQRLGLGARQRAVQEFSIERMVERNEAFYARCGEAPNP